MSGTTDNSLDVLLAVADYVFARLSAYVTFCNAHKALWVPTGFAVACATIILFKCALSIGSGHNNNF